MPLDGMAADPQALAEGAGVVSLGQQPQHIELAWCELADQPGLVLSIDCHLTLPRDCFGEQRHWYQYVADRRPTNGVNDLVRGGGLRQVRGSACIDGVEERILGVVGVV